MKYCVVGTAGHIDHGKSALVRALTGTDPDRLEEEKRRGITIDLGFAHLDLGDGLRIAFVDVPGHERFVKNMLAGVGGIDLVLLVIAADESIKPQTREHFDICRLLGIRRGIIALTKADLVEPEILDLARIEAQELVAGSFLENAPILAVSSKTGQGLDALRAELRRVAMEASPRPAHLPFRLPIDRAFVIKGFGTVVTGTLVAGTIAKEAEAEIQPVGKAVRVRGVQVHNAAAESAVAGQRTALNLAGVEAKDIARGMTLVPPGLFDASTRLDVSFVLLPTARPLATRSRVHLHSGTAETVAEAFVLGPKQIKSGQKGFAQLRLQSPGIYLPGDRFILRQFSPVVTIGGGVILDNLPARHRADDDGVCSFLSKLETSDARSRIALLVEQARELSLADLIKRTGFHPNAILQHAKSLQTERKMLILGDPPAALADGQSFADMVKRAVREIESFHKANPLVAGVRREALRQSLNAAKATPPSQLLMEALLDKLVKDGTVELRDEMVVQKGREVQLSAEEARAKGDITRAFEEAGLAAPAVAETLARLSLDRARAEKILQLLLREKTLVKVSDDLVFHRSALERLRKTLITRKATNNRISVTAFKDLTGLSRKYTIPLLEYLDRERFTRREGDERIILGEV